MSDEKSPPQGEMRPSLTARVRRATGVNSAKCYQCGKCSAGCPMAVETALRPHDILRMVQRDETKRLLSSESLWLCLTCETCTARCPNDCDPARVIDALREIAATDGLSEPPRRVGAFHKAFLQQIRSTGRIFEFGLVAAYKLRSGALFDDVLSVPAMLGRGKLALTPSRIRGLREFRRAFDRSRRGDRPSDGADAASIVPTEAPAALRALPPASTLIGKDEAAAAPAIKIGYFPGCSLHATSREYAESIRAMSGALGIELQEIDDWACCGATSAHATSRLLGVSLPARTLALAKEQGHERILAPCAACFSRLSAARHEVSRDPELATQVEKSLGRQVDPDLGVVSIVRFLHDLAPRIRGRVKRPLAELKVACYYGCLLARPAELTDLDDVEAPTSMEKVVEAAGAKTVKWNKRLECCGGGFSLSRTGSVVRLSRSILEDARAAGADVVAVACPMCHSNLDFRQKAIARRTENAADLPVLFLSQIVGLALGESPAALGLDRHFVSTSALTARLPAAGKADEPAATEVG